MPEKPQPQPTVPQELDRATRFYLKVQDRWSVQNKLDRLAKKDKSIKARDTLRVPPKKVALALKERYLNRDILHTDPRLLNGFNILFGTGEPLSEIVDLETIQYESVSPVASVLAVALYEAKGESENGILSLIRKGIPPKLKFIYDKKEADQVLTSQLAVNPIYDQANLKEVPVQRVVYLQKEYSDPFAQTCYVLAQFEKQLPGVVAEKLPHLSLSPMIEVQNALGMLQMMHSLHFMETPNFLPLSKALRAIVMKSLHSYQELKEEYAYSVLDQAEFWVDGELEFLAEKRLGKQGKTNPDEAVVTLEEATTVRLPSLDKWNAQLSTIDSLEEKVRTTTSSHVIRDQTVKESIRTRGKLDGTQLLRSMRKELAAGALARQELKATQRAVHQSYMSSFSRELSYLGEIGEFDDQIMMDICTQLVASVRGRADISMKSRSWIDDYLASTQESTYTSQRLEAYRLQPEKLQQHPLFHWLARLSSPQAREHLLAAVRNQPAEFTVLHRLMVNTFTSETLSQNEAEFMLVPSYQFSTTDFEQTLAFFESLCDIFAAQTPSEEEVLRNIPHRRQDVPHFKSEYLQGFLAENWKWVSRPLFLGKRFPRQVGVTKTAAAVTAVASLIGIAAGGLYVHANDKTYTQEQGPVGREAMARIPDSISREGLEKLEPYRVATLLHLPESMQVVKDVPQFLIPQYLEDFFFLDQDTPDNPTGGPMTEVTYGDPPADFKADPEQLVYRPDVVTTIMYPPEGFRIVKVFQEGGQRPWLSGAGDISWKTANEQPYHITIVAEPLKIGTTPAGSALPTGVTMYEGLTAGTYNLSHFDYQKAIELNLLLKNEPVLQKLHDEMVGYFNQRIPTDTQEELSEAVIAFSARYYQYIHSSRYYSLSLRSRETTFQWDTEFGYLRALADNPDRGFFCSFAAKSFEDFWASVGVMADSEIVTPVAVYGDELWSHIGHEKNRLLLPDGEVAFIDTTPPVVSGKTPQEDLDALRWKGPDDKPGNILVDFIKMAGAGGIATGAGLTLLVGLHQTYGWQKNRRIWQKHNRLKELGKSKLNFDDLEQRIVDTGAASIGLLSIEDQKSFLDNAAEVLSLIKEVDRKEYGGLIKWVATEFVPTSQLPTTVEDILAKTEVLSREVFKQIAEGWLADEAGVRGLIPETVRSTISKQVQAGASLEGISRQLTQAVELGLLINGVELLSMTDTIKQGLLRDRSQQLKTTLLLQEKVKLAHTLILMTAAGLDMSQRSSAYIAYLNQVFDPLS